MGGWPDDPVTCPECDGEGKVLSPILLVDGGNAGSERCDVCHGLGRISKIEADAWARSQGPDPRDAAEDEAINRFFEWGC